MDYYEKCFYQNIDYRYLIIYQLGFFGGGPKLFSPPDKTLGWGPVAPAVTNLFSRAFQQLKSIGSGKCNPLENI
jgi:hypothetical protein